MDFTFLSSSGAVAFFRSDAEQAEWTEEELSLLCAFPYDPKKIIERGMTVLFQDPATDDWHAYEIRNLSTFAAENYQQFRAESIAISELTDCHIQEAQEFSDVTAQQALSGLLNGTGWAIGEVTATGKSFGDISRGSVWDAVATIQKNWNVYIMPRVTVNSSGINKRYLDILKTGGIWRGVRLAVNKNVPDPCVTYDDSELKTALYGYGASYTEGDGEDKQSHEYNFADVVWSKTSSHPAKPAGQKYLEDPEKTKLYGRDGKPRFGYYQTTEIDDPEILLNKTWEVLQTVSDPKISITGTAVDLYRLGYNDQPLRLHDTAIVDLEPIGVQFSKEIIQLTVDLLDPSRTTVTIGDYIPSIIYINRDTEEEATGGGGSGGSSNKDKKQGEFETEIYWNERNIILNAKHINEHGDILQQAGMYIDPITGVLIYAEDTENNIGSKFHVMSDRITSEVGRLDGEITGMGTRITQTEKAITLEAQNRISGDNVLSGRIDVEAGRITAEVKNRISADNELSGRITVTATAITEEVTARINGDDELSGRIDIHSNQISLVVTQKDGVDVVNTASIVLGINDQTGSYVKIKADTINLSGYVTVSDLNATNASITNLVNGTTVANKLSCTTLVCGTLTKGSYSYGEAAFYDMNGNIKYCLCRS